MVISPVDLGFPYNLLNICLPTNPHNMVISPVDLGFPYNLLNIPTNPHNMVISPVDLGFPYNLLNIPIQIPTTWSFPPYSPTTYREPNSPTNGNTDRDSFAGEWYSLGTEMGGPIRSSEHRNRPKSSSILTANCTKSPILYYSNTNLCG